MNWWAELVVFESIAPNDADSEEFGSEGIDCSDGTYGGGGGGGAGGSDAFWKVLDELLKSDSLALAFPGLFIFCCWLLFTLHTSVKWI